jgi:hypothetical protein
VIDCWLSEKTRKSGTAGNGEGIGFARMLSMRQMERLLCCASEQAKDEPNRQFGKRSQLMQTCHPSTNDY